MTLATVAAVVGIGAGVNSIVQSNRNRPGGGGSTDQAANTADPFRQHRGFYGLELGTQYNNLQRFNPADIEIDPEYQFLRDQGIGAINKGAAASGMLGSGTRLLDLQKFGTGLASNFADRKYNRQLSLLQMLGGWSGATTGSPTGAASALQNGNNAANNQFGAGLQAISSGIAGVGRGINWNSGSSGAPDPNIWQGYYGPDGP